MTTATKENVFKLRMDSLTMEMLERASAYLELDKSKFIRQSIREKAEAILAEHEKTTFSKQDWLMFFDMIENPPAPTKRMRDAAKLYQEIVSSDEV